MPYVLIAEQHAEQLSRALMRLLRPSHLRTDERTDLYCEVLTHPQTGAKAIALPDHETVPIHVQADGQELAALLQTFVIDGAITTQEAAGIAAAVASQAGGVVRLADFVPPSWQANVRTSSQMTDDGWFAFPDDPIG
jgi:hypothetical protein